MAGRPAAARPARGRRRRALRRRARAAGRRRAVDYEVDTDARARARLLHAHGVRGRSRGRSARRTRSAAAGATTGLVERLGGPDTPGVGFAAGVERILLAAEAAGEPGAGGGVRGGGRARAPRASAFALARRLRERGLRVQLEQAGRSLKGQLKQADRIGARATVIVGGGIEVKDMGTGEQTPAAGRRRRRSRWWRARSSRERAAPQPLPHRLGRASSRADERGRARAGGRLGAPPARPRRADLHRPARQQRAAPARVPPGGGARGARRRRGGCAPRT